MMIYPLKFQPIYKERLWGGTLLREVFGRETPEGKRIGESWELSDLPDDKSVISNGEFANQTLESVIRKYPEEITGSKQAGPFPLLVKFLDCGEVLSVQVHPDETACKRLGKGESKTECWYIISAKPGAVIYKGLKKSVTREQFSKAVKEGTVEKTLNKIEVNTGQCYYLPAGTPHAIGAELLVAEIETPSDTTFRIFDWNRVDENCKPRPLHINEALESIHFDRPSDELVATTIGRLVDCEFFKIDKGRQMRNSEVLLSADSTPDNNFRGQASSPQAGLMKTMIIISGSGTITGEINNVEFKSGETILIPAAYEGVLRFSAETEYLTVTT
jgi:mannose-6-phosphate isomerase